MAKTRDATATIKGYFYQFDYSILKLLKASGNATVCIEGIEDVDILNIDEKISIQCKYYEATEYNHSIIGKPIRFMLKHFAENRGNPIKYMLYGYYSKGQHKLPDVIDVNFAKKHFFKYRADNIAYEAHISLGLEDEDIQEFLEALVVDINATEFEKQNQNILAEIQVIFSCTLMEAEFYYNKALKIIRDLATKAKKEDRETDRQSFLRELGSDKENLFNLWYIGIRGIKTYCQNVKKLYFSELNRSPYSRFFLIDCRGDSSYIDIKSMLIMISGKMTNISKREKTPFCPYVHLYGVDDRKLLLIKKALRDDGIVFLDGHSFKDADFHCDSICVEANHQNQIRLKIVNELGNVSEILNKLSNVRELYQFYLEAPFYNNDEYRHIVLPITSINDLNQII
ncbi:hypothetical protein BMT55_14085 [Listeria newyorkensis]|uniref:Restriction endonuclease n=1 Tax=Listeria newyorkensis TaxID=1497681 RepID=A0ABX4XK46_9LIST|nr:DUF4297 family anti-phage-associated protein [Listeria newyorkensis]KGL43402.1 hypothetical protein EP58_08030 [Listeria newyorkensis]PNP88995.1 hypothetical protein BMT55_14085 [Listeria newyorkensis]WAO20788.1 hypothetical protein OTR81_10850 [Listeria newyorkensis]SQC55268.1 Uncharacterised protein [Listeria newyorkensis]